jgi:hypothetical protein
MANDNNEQLYFVDITVKWGKQNGESQKAESVGGQNWGHLTYDQAVAVENVAVIPNLNQMMIDAGDMGLDTIEAGDLIRGALSARAADKVK